MSSIEHVAQALLKGFNHWAVEHPNERSPIQQWEELPAHQREFLLFQARTAIEALREPSDEMIEAWWQDGNQGFGEGEEIKPIWQAMIDKALSE